MPRPIARLEGPLTKQDAWKVGYRIGLTAAPFEWCCHRLIARGAPFLSPAFLSGILGYNKGLVAGSEGRAAWAVLGYVLSLDEMREKGVEPAEVDNYPDNNLYTL